MATKVKICGVTQSQQARQIAVQGADYIGCIIEFPESPRSVTRDQARILREVVEKEGSRMVGVVVNKTFDDLKDIVEITGIRILQLHGDENEEYIKQIKTLGVEAWKVVNGSVGAEDFQPVQGADKYVVDAVNPLHGAGGSGELSDWNFAKRLREQGFKVVLSGGLSSDNVEEAIKQAKPSVVDASSKLEMQSGIKNLEKVKDFIREARTSIINTDNS